jgi:Fe2+ or Zn2+ uptake regulation protein
MSKRGEEKRAEILSFMRGAYGALSAYDVLSGPRSTHPTIGLSTVYNALATLTESGVIHRVESRKADIVCQWGGRIRHSFSQFATPAERLKNAMLLSS